MNCCYGYFYIPFVCPLFFVHHRVITMILGTVHHRVIAMIPGTTVHHRVITPSGAKHSHLL